MKPPRQKVFNDRAALGNTAPAQPIATRSELAARIRARSAPKIERVLEPSGHMRHAVKAVQASENERRIKHITERLSIARQKLRTGFAHSRDSDRGR